MFKLSRNRKKKPLFQKPGVIELDLVSDDISDSGTEYDTSDLNFLNIK